METPIRQFNPFVYGRPLSVGNGLPRQKEKEFLVHQAEGGHNSRVTAPRRYGKTTLLLSVLQEAEQLGMQTVYVDLYGVQTIEEIVGRIEAAYRKGLHGKISNWLVGKIRQWQITLKITPGGVGGEVQQRQSDYQKMLFSFLDLPQEIFQKTGNKTLIIFDEFQDILDAGNNIDRLIRSRIQLHTDEASYIFAGSHPGLMTKLFNGSEKAFYTQATSMILKPLPNDQLSEFVSDTFANTERNIDKYIELYLQLVKGHPQRSMLVAHHLWENCMHDTEDIWYLTLEDVYEQVYEGFDQLWQGLSVKEKHTLSAIAKYENKFLAKDALEEFKLSRSTAVTARDKLIRNGHLYMRSSKDITIVDPLLDAWLKNGRLSLYTL